MQKWLKALLKPFRLQAQYNQATESLLESIGKYQALRHQLEQANGDIQALRARLDLAEGVCEAFEEYKRINLIQVHSVPAYRERTFQSVRAYRDICAMLSKWQKERKG